MLTGPSSLGLLSPEGLSSLFRADRDFWLRFPSWGDWEESFAQGINTGEDGGKCLISGSQPGSKVAFVCLCVSSCMRARVWRGFGNALGLAQPRRAAATSPAGLSGWVCSYGTFLLLLPAWTRRSLPPGCPPGRPPVGLAQGGRGRSWGRHWGGADKGSAPIPASCCGTLGTAPGLPALGLAGAAHPSAELGL